MASSASISMAMPLTYSSQKRLSSPETFFRPLAVKPSKAIATTKAVRRLKTEGSMKENVVKGLTAAAVAVSVVVPDVAMAADSGMSASLKNFLLSIGAGGVVLVAILGAVIGVSNFDPVKRA